MSQRARKSREGKVVEGWKRNKAFQDCQGVREGLEVIYIQVGHVNIQFSQGWRKRRETSELRGKRVKADSQRFQRAETGHIQRRPLSTRVKY
jgi:hypothetical protein